MESESAKGIAGCCCCIVSLTVILVIMAHGVVEPTEWAIKRDKISQNIDTKNVWTGGRHYIGLFSAFVTYPAIQVPIEFSDSRTATRTKLNTRTQEGLDLSLHFSLQYQLIKEELPQLYRLLETDYDRVYERLARNSVLEVASSYTASAYWLDRVKIGDDMRKNLDTNFKKVHAKVMGFQLLKINLPDRYENEIVKTQVMKQEKLTYEKLRDVSLSRQEVRNIIAAGDRQVNVLIADNTSKAQIETNKGEG